MCRFCDVNQGETNVVSNVDVKLESGNRVVEVHELIISVLNWDGYNHYLCAGYGPRGAENERVAVEIPINFCPMCGRTLGE